MKAPQFNATEVSILGFTIFVLLLILAFAGCGEREQAIADSAETINQAALAQRQGVAVEPTASAIQANAQAIVKATGKTPVPAATAAEWQEDTPKAASNAGNQAEKTGKMGAGAWAGIIAGAVGLLGVARFVAPLIPGLGPAWKVGVDFLWNIAQHKKAKEAEAVQLNIATVAASAVPAIKQFREMLPHSWANLPHDLRVALETLQKANAS